MPRIVVDAAKPESAALAEAVRAIRAGGVVAMPTDTFYGLAVDPFRQSAVERLYALKGRESGKAVPLVAADVAQVVDYLAPLTAQAIRLIARFWPGPLTLLLAAPPTLSPAVSGGTGKVGVRVPGHAVARALCRACGVPLTASSANLAGAQPSADPDEVEGALGSLIDVLVDAGVTAGGPPSTIVDVTGDAPILVRAGAIAWGEIEALAKRSGE